MTGRNKLDREPYPLLIVLSGPSGAGKDAVLSRMRESGYPLTYITTVTTRPKRQTERDNVDYRFVTQAEFEAMVARHELLEHANVYGNWYGVPEKPVKEALRRGRDVIVKVDIQGAATIRQKIPQAVFIFLAAPSIEETADRLKERKTESDLDLSLRVNTAEREMEHLPRFDYLVFNPRDRVEEAVADLKAIITAEKCRTEPRRATLQIT